MPVEPPTFAGYLRHLRNHGSGTHQHARMSRADLAGRAGIGVGYLTKLEQGAAQHPSADVVDALATALGTDDTQRIHLHDLVVYDQETAQPPADATADATADAEIDDQVRSYINSLVPHLAGIVDDAWNVRYANPEYARIYRHLIEVGNVLVWFFEVPEARAIMIRWQEEARLTVAWLRALMVRRPRSPLFSPLLNRLATNTDFAAMWNSNEVLLGRQSSRMLVRDLDHGVDLHLAAQVFPWSNPAKALQMYLGVRVTPDDATSQGQ